ncbi:MAG: aminopeptidase [Thermoplasmata archaeon]|nr:aminopeptidase [Thermoplasmata archaeon]
MATKKAASKKGGQKKDTLEDKLAMKKELVWKTMSKTERKKAFSFAEGYKEFMSRVKTEREAVDYIKAEAEKHGFKPYEEIRRATPGTRFYITHKGKAAALVVMGKRDPLEGVRIVGAHIDSPRLDLKQNPLYEDGDTNLALFKTHYYGGIKKYQWANIPLALHGVAYTKDGKKVEIAIGEEPGDPVFTVCDLLPHLARGEQAKRTMPQVIKGEELNILVGSMPVDDEEVKNQVKMWVLDYLNREYGLVEEDLTSAEIEAVPAGPARDVGFDRSMVGSYGQDDRISAYTALEAIFEVEKPEYTAVAMFFDKEEVGSDGTTGAQSRLPEQVVGDILALKHPEYRYSHLRKALMNSKVLSADVNAGVNPTFKSVHEISNASRMGYGVVITKFTGSGGKYSANDATAEFATEIRLLFNKHKIPWQLGELGKVDEGGGGTIAKFLSKYNMDVIDCGAALLSMHSPFEISSKADLYYTYLAYKVFLRS